MEKIRDSKYELLRVVSMFMIVLGHVIVHGNVQTNVSGALFVLVETIKAFLIVHVNSFILVTGYYQCKSDFKLYKLFALNNAAWFYRVALLIVLTLFNVITVGKIEMIRHAFPIDLSVYWFIDMYLILYCLSPFLNILIKKMDKSMHLKMVLAMFVIFAILPSLTAQKSFFNNGGYSITNFVLLYFIGAYFRNYPINFFEFYKIGSDKVKRLIYALLFIGITTFNLCLLFFGIHIYGMSTISTAISTVIQNMTFSYDNPLVIGASISYFLWFGCLTIKNKFINKLSSLTFGIYLIHDNPFVRANLYQLFGLKAGVSIYSYMIIPKIFAVAILIFAVCAVVEWLRKIIFKFIYDRKFAGNMRMKFYNYLEEIKTRQPIRSEELKN